MRRGCATLLVFYSVMAAILRHSKLKLKLKLRQAAPAGRQGGGVTGFVSYIDGPLEPTLYSVNPTVTNGMTFEIFCAAVVYPMPGVYPLRDAPPPKRGLRRCHMDLAIMMCQGGGSDLKKKVASKQMTR
ncbi:unnamed protein product, partial [Discosporangium mesarthrocarpum]